MKEMGTKYISVEFDKGVWTINDEKNIIEPIEKYSNKLLDIANKIKLLDKKN